LCSGTPQDSRSICPRVRGRSGARGRQAVPGGTAGEVDQQTGEGGVVYGVTVTRPDGTAVEVRLDKDFHVLDTQPAGHYHDNDSDDE
jgi:hypothetical protein